MNTNRRNFIKTAGAGISLGSIFPMVACTSGIRNQSFPDNQQLFIGDDIAVAETTYGKVKGFILRNIYHFRGIPYGADTSGENRFMPPQRPESWTGVYPAVWWGNSAPQIMDNRYNNQYASFVDHWNYDDVSENCLKLNIWTPGIMTERKDLYLYGFMVADIEMAMPLNKMAMTVRI
jgi:para-nitrobenzyl esterase